MAQHSPQRRMPRSEREAEILAAARQVLEQDGASNFSVPDIAASAGVSEATVFNYFPTRRDLIFRVVSDWMLPVIERLEADVPRVRGCQARIAFFAARHLIETAAAPGMHRLIYRELHWDNYYGSVLHRMNQRYAGLLIWIVQDAQAAGEVRQDIDPAIVRDSLFGAIHHIGWRTLLNGRPLDIESTAERLAAQVMGGIASASRTQAEGAEDRLEAVVARLEAVADDLSRGER